MGIKGQQVYTEDDVEEVRERMDVVSKWHGGHATRDCVCISATVLTAGRPLPYGGVPHPDRVATIHEPGARSAAPSGGLAYWYGAGGWVPLPDRRHDYTGWGHGARWVVKRVDHLHEGVAWEALALSSAVLTWGDHAAILDLTGVTLSGHRWWRVMLDDAAAMRLLIVVRYGQARFIPSEHDRRTIAVYPSHRVRSDAADIHVGGPQPWVVYGGDSDDLDADDLAYGRAVGILANLYHRSVTTSHNDDLRGEELADIARACRGGEHVRPPFVMPELWRHVPHITHKRTGGGPDKIGEVDEPVIRTVRRTPVDMARTKLAGDDDGTM